MLITASCPFCRLAYQVQATLRGQFVRCPNAACRKIFAVPVEETAAAPVPPPKSSAPVGNGQRSGSVADMVTLLPAEQAAPPTDAGPTSKHVSEMLPVEPTEPAAPATAGGPAAGDWWQAAPPVRGKAAPPPVVPSSPPPSPTPAATWWRDAPPARGSQAPAEPTRKKRPTPSAPTETQRMPILPPETTGQPLELPPGVWEPPPVRRAADTDAQTSEAIKPPGMIQVREGAAGDKDAQPLKETTASEAHRPRLSKRRAWFVITGLFLLTFGVLGAVGVWVWLAFHRSEEARFAEAIADYRQGSFGKAESEFRELAQKFPDSTQVEEYRFLADWSAVCGTVSNPDADPAAVVPQLDHFISNHKKDLLMVQYGHDAGQQLLKLAKAFAARNSNPPDEQPLKTAERIEQLRRTVASLGPDALTKEEAALIDADVGKVRRAVEKARKRRDVLAQIRRKAKEPWMDAIKRVRTLLARRERELPGISQDPAARAALADLYKGHLDSVVFQRLQGDIRALPEGDADNPEDDPDKTIVFAPLLGTAAPGRAPENDPIVLALVRGV
ncbi:MAG: hypothetical protein ACRELG_13450, partial [Gemmataceae bacterium]